MDPIAIVGMSCLFPDAETPEQFWENLVAGKDSTSTATVEDFGVDPRVFFSEEKRRVDKVYNLRGGFVRGFEPDLSGYAVDASVLEPLDDLYKWTLYAGRQALKDSGHWERRNLSRCGLILGNLSFPTHSSRRFFNRVYATALDPMLSDILDHASFSLPTLVDGSDSPDNTRTAGYPAILAAQALALGGVAISLDAACASSIYAFEIACRYLNTGRADTMLAGAVSCADPLFVHHGFSAFQAYPKGRDSKPLDARSGGLIDGQGAGMLVLKRLADADRDGDRIHGIIRGVGLSNDGRGGSVLNPDIRGQLRAFERAYTQAGVDPGDVAYVECHATGTPVGDPVELDAMARFWGDRRLPRIGSVKSNLGHLLTASAMASTIKVLMSFRHGQIPPTIRVTDPRASRCGRLGAGQIVSKTIPWPGEADRRLAGISAFGFGGTNAHLVLEHCYECVETAARPDEPSSMCVAGVAVTCGGCKDVESFDRTIREDIRHDGSLPRERWSGLEASRSVRNLLGNPPDGAYLGEIDVDFLNLKTPPNEDNQLIPQHLLMTQVADQAIQDARLKSGGRVAVIVVVETELETHRFLGRSDLSWQIRNGLERAGIPLDDRQIDELEGLVQSAVYGAGNANQFTSFIGNIIAGRVSALWDFSGPAFTVSAEELGVPRALEIAHMMLESDDMEAVVVGAVDLSGGFESVLSRHCRGIGTRRVGEGAGAVVLRRERGPSSPQVYANIQEVQFDEQKSVSLDYLEIVASCDAKCDSRPGIAGDGCVLGSVSENVGRTGQAAGMIGLIRVCLELDRKQWSRAGVHIASQEGDALVQLVPAGREASDARSAASGHIGTETKRLVKSVTLGSTPIRDALRIDENRGRFTTCAPVLEEPRVAASDNADVSTHRAYLAGRLNAFRARSVDLSARLSQRGDGAGEHVWSQQDLETFAEGSIADVFGPEYAAIDGYPRRVRLPMHPYLLVSRVTKLDAQRGVFEPCGVTTEYDIPHGAWYSVDGTPPWAVVVESGQCDLLLISYLGIDFECKGERVYRLLDCTLTFLDRMPREGDTLRYDIKINSFARSGDSLLFFFSYECFVGDRMILKMEDGCAGFFTDHELAQGKGVIFSESDLKKKAAIEKQQFNPLLTCDRRQFSHGDLVALTKGDLSACFGGLYEAGDRNASLRLPPESMLMIDRITSLDPSGGVAGLGEVIAEKELAPDHWYFPCHFKDDQVLAGSLIGEACAQLLQFYTLYLGLQTRTSDARFEPMVGSGQKVRCRGQVVPTDRLLRYRLDIKRIDLDPVPGIVADVEVWLEQKMVVHFENLGLQLVEKEPASSTSGQLIAHKTRFGPEDVSEFATGSMAKCFGEAYRQAETKRCPRTPNGDLQLITRVDVADGPSGASSEQSLVSGYDVPVSPWYYEQNPGGYLPYSILMEIALQPSGFMAGCRGTTLPYPDIDFYYRNLDGSGHLIRDVDPRGKTIGNRMRLLSSTSLQGVVIQKYTFELFCDDQPFYVGDAAFGFFAKAALSRQVGLDRGEEIEPWYREHAHDLREVDLEQFQVSNPDRLGFNLASGQLHFIDSGMVAPRGGRYGNGYAFASKVIDPEDWFYACHFYQDPVMPGSLGVEAMQQALQLFALETGMGSEFESPRFCLTADHRTTWKYRGHILPSDRQMSLEVHIKRIDRNHSHATLIADASLWNDRIRIYEVTDLALGITESTSRGFHV